MTSAEGAFTGVEANSPIPANVKNTTNFFIFHSPFTYFATTFLTVAVVFFFPCATVVRFLATAEHPLLQSWVLPQRAKQSSGGGFGP
jgi:hypothetical protein